MRLKRYLEKGSRDVKIIIHLPALIMRLQRYRNDLEMMIEMRSRDVKNNTLASTDNAIATIERNEIIHLPALIMRLQRYGKDRSRDVRNNTLASIQKRSRDVRNNTLANAIATIWKGSI